VIPTMQQMSSNTTRQKSVHIASPGHAAYAVIMIGLGVLGLIKRDFTVVWQGVPNGVPARTVLAYLCALVSLACGVGLLWRQSAALAARVLLGYLILWFLLWRVYGLFVLPFVGGTWSCGQTMVMTAAAWVLFVWFATDWDHQRLRFATGDMGLCIARLLYALGLIPFGIAHFVYPKETIVLIPGWLPWHVFWAYFTGATFIIASLAAIFGVFARLAVTLSAIQIGLFALLVWAPRIATGTPLSAFQWGEVVMTLALTAAAWVVADSYRGTPWLLPRPRRHSDPHLIHRLPKH
jgi:uncharacterized membrane protein